MQTPSAEHVLWRLLEFDLGDILGFIAPVCSGWLVQAVLNGRFRAPDAMRKRGGVALPEGTRRAGPLDSRRCVSLSCVDEDYVDAARLEDLEGRNPVDACGWRITTQPAIR